MKILQGHIIFPKTLEPNYINRLVYENTEKEMKKGGEQKNPVNSIETMQPNRLKLKLSKAYT